MSLNEESDGENRNRAPDVVEPSAISRLIPWVVIVIAAALSALFYTDRSIIAGNNAEVFYGFIFAGVAAVVLVYAVYSEYRRRTRLSG